MERIYIAEVKEKEEILLQGWVYDVRKLAKLEFIILRDVSGMIQCVIPENLMEKTKDLTLESVVEIKGIVKKANVKADFTRKDLEIEVKNIVILNKAETLPILVNEKSSKSGVKTELPTRLDFRSLDVRKRNVRAIFKIQSTIINSFREFFFEKDFIEIQPPGIIATSTEGGTDLFKIDYFGKKAYLAQSPQLYKQFMAISLEKIFSTSAVWRAEKHDTSKHINEIRQLDIELAFADDKKVMKLVEGVIQYISNKIIEKNKEDLEILGIDLKIPKAKYLTYEEAINVLNKHGFKMKIGEDFEPEAERKLCELFADSLIFTYDWPVEIKPFYIWPKDKKNSAGFDVLYGGVEICSGGQRVHVPEILINQLKNKGLKPKDFEWYIDSFRYGAPMHAGWSIGLERLTKAILNLDNIREATLFPRDRKRLTP